jgi:hypothetical protein
MSQGRIPKKKRTDSDATWKSSNSKDSSDWSKHSTGSLNAELPGSEWMDLYSHLLEEEPTQSALTQAEKVKQEAGTLYATDIIQWGTPPFFSPEDSDLSSLHKRITERVNQIEPVSNTNEWDSGDFIEWQARSRISKEAGEQYINDFKNQWVRGYKKFIIEAANEFNIPPRLLAAIAWREVGGDPHFLDTGAHSFRSLGIFSGAPNETSFGDLSVQIRRAAEALGYDPNQLNGKQENRIISSLQDSRQNIFIAAKHLSDLRDKYLPGREPNALSERDLLALAGAYNVGPIYPTLEDFWKYDYAGGYGRSAFNGLAQCGCF